MNGNKIIPMAGNNADTFDKIARPKKVPPM
jgi:hypothetical protein